MQDSHIYLLITEAEQVESNDFVPLFFILSLCHSTQATGLERALLCARGPVARPSADWIATLRRPRTLRHLPAFHHRQLLSTHWDVRAAGMDVRGRQDCLLAPVVNGECTELTCRLDRVSGSPGG